SKPAPAGGQVVDLRATSFQVTIPTSATVPAGASMANFTIGTSTIGNNGDVRIYAAVNGQGQEPSSRLSLSARNSFANRPAITLAAPDFVNVHEKTSTS